MANKWLKVFPDATKNKVDYLIDGKDYFKQLVEAIRTTSNQDHYIYILGWMLDLDFPLIRGDIDTMLIKLIRTAAKKGVEVRILIWENPIEGYKKKADANIPKLNGIDNVKAFIDEHTYPNPESVKFIEDHSELIKEKLADLDDVFTDREMFTAILYQLIKKNVGSHHEKVMVVKGKDGLIGFCGGIDINSNRFDGYHDSACKVQGPAAYEILEKFRKRWKNHPNAKKVKLRGAGEKKPKAIEKDFHYAQVVGTYNSPDGTDKDRSLKKAFLKVIEKAEKYIYIEDQYLVNLEVANALNKKLKESAFMQLIIAVQDTSETTDIMIPARKRGEFWDAVLAGTTAQQKKKALLTMINKKEAKKYNYHAGMHAKSLVVDDELAIIGSANVNQRSFTCDSETSLIVFDDASVKSSFAKQFREATWMEFIEKRNKLSSNALNWGIFSFLIQNDDSFCILVTYYNSTEDIDVQIRSQVNSNMVILFPLVMSATDNDITQTTVALSPQTLTQIIDQVWEYIIDPVVK